MLLLFAGCAATDTSYRKAEVLLEIGASTKSDAIALFGPAKAHYRNGSQLLYEEVIGISIPIPAGAMGLGFADIVSHEFLFLEFNDAGLLVDVTFEQAEFPEAGPILIREPLSSAFTREVTDILAADVAWVRLEAGCNKMSIWSDESFWDKPVVFVQGVDFVGIAKWQSDGRFRVVWTSDSTDIVGVSLDSWGRNKCVVIEAKDVPVVTFALSSLSPWLMTDPSRTKQAFSKLTAKYSEE
jgi:hypothetical protein